MLRRSMSPTSTTPMPMPSAQAWIFPASSSRSAALSFFESSTPRSLTSRGRMTAAARTGPASGPTPTSSTPATRVSPAAQRPRSVRSNTPIRAACRRCRFPTMMTPEQPTQSTVGADSPDASLDSHRDAGACDRSESSRGSAQQLGAPAPQIAQKDQDLADHGAERIDAAVRQRRRTAGHECLMQLIGKRIGHRQRQRAQHPSGFPSRPAAAAAGPERQAAEHEELEEVSALADDGMRVENVSSAEGRKEVVQQRIDI